MSPTAKNIFAVVAGFIVGSIVNMGLIMVLSEIIPPPAGVDVTNMESLKNSMHLFEPIHFLSPFLAHALGTLVGAAVAGMFAASRKMRFALGIGTFFMLGGIVNAFMLPSPVWFMVLDLAVAYLPMGWLGGKFAESKTQF
ncbi:MAG: hypothetical protein R3C41_10160 [Calditrichia bacterium]|nr:hypothetical protein [Calditrichia bacterium]